MPSQANWMISSIKVKQVICWAANDMIPSTKPLQFKVYSVPIFFRATYVSLHVILLDSKPVLSCWRGRWWTAMFRVQFLIISKIIFSVSRTWSTIKVATIISEAFITTYEPARSITIVCCCSAIVTFNPPDVKIFVCLTKSPPWVKEVVTLQICTCVVCVTEALRMDVAGDSHVSWAYGEMLHVRQRQTVRTPVYFQWNLINRIINTKDFFKLVSVF